MTSRYPSQLCSAIAVMFVAAAVGAHQDGYGDEFTAFLRGNDRFGFRLPEQVRLGAPATDVALAPISLSLLFGALYGHTFDASENELREAFGFRYSGTAGS